jgi:hypothetical protein
VSKQHSQDSPGGSFSDLYEAMQSRPHAQRNGQSTAAEALPAPPSPEEQHPPKRDEKGARTRARTRVTTHAAAPDTPVDTNTPLIEMLYQNLQEKQHLASSTFRFRPEELRDLDAVFEQVKRQHGRKVSKNDLPRLALIWLLEDYERNKDSSVLVQVLTRL